MENYIFDKKGGLMDEDKDILQEEHGSGIISTLVFVVIAVVVMYLLRVFLNY